MANECAESFLKIMALNRWIVRKDCSSIGRKCTLTTVAPLTHDEQKAAEAAFRGLPINPSWSQSAQQIYLRILAVTDGRDVVADADTSSLAIGGTVK
jgi:hypothetical protein